MLHIIDTVEICLKQTSMLNSAELLLLSSEELVLLKSHDGKVFIIGQSST